MRSTLGQSGPVPLRLRLRGSRARSAGWLGIALLLATLAFPAVAAAREEWSGRRLDDALRELRERGLPIVWSTAVVTPDLRVGEEPASRRPRRLLDELVAPHGLEIRPGHGGRLLVVPSSTAGEGARLGVVVGRVVTETGAPAPGVVVEIAGSGLSSRSGDDGRFRIGPVPAGTHDVALLLPGGARLEREIEVPASAEVEVELRVPVLSVSADEVTVVSRMSLYDDRPSSTLSLSEEEIDALPHFGDDLNRAVRVLPGVTANDFEAAFQVRGGLSREVLVRLDGLELYEPYHLKDFSGLLSVVDPTVVGGVDLLPGAFPAEYGDRSSSVLDLTSVEPRAGHGQLGISFATAWAGASGLFDDGRGAWLASARRGYLDVLLDLAGENEGDAPTPSYWDLFGKLDYRVSEGNQLGVHLLSATDSLDYEENEPGERLAVDTDWDNRYVWLRHGAIASRRAVVDSTLFVGELGHDRAGFAVEIDVGIPDDRVAVTDRRDVDLVGLRQDWALDLGARHLLKTGFELRRFDVTFDYHDDLARRFPIDDPRFESAVDVTDFEERFEGEHEALWGSERLLVTERSAIEIGLRWDRQSLTDEQQFSPRLNLLWDLGPGGRLRAGWGHFFQSQRPQELEVQFGETEHLPAQRAEHWSLGWEGELGRIAVARVEAYREEVSEPQRRYEVLFDPTAPIPQVAIDLVEVAPEEALAEGVELYLRGRASTRRDWWLSYVWSRTRDVVDGRPQPRWYDQPHALTAAWIHRFGPRWTLATTWRYHTGWPTTSVDAVGRVDEQGELTIDYDVGPFYAERLADYHSLDVRVSRRSVLRRGVLTLMLDIQNLYDRENERGLFILDRSVVPRPDGDFDVVFDPASWLGLLPSLGVGWEF